MRCSVLLAPFLLAACASVPPIDAVASGDAVGSRDRVVMVPVTGADGIVVPIQTRICRPASDAPAPLVVINHGSPPNAAARPRMVPGRCGGEAAQWFLRRGYVVAFPLRRGYGLNGGGYPESSGKCSSAEFERAALESGRDISAAVENLRRLPFVQADRVVVVGQSAGGWGAMGYDSVPHPGVVAFVSMAGGRGGHVGMQPNHNCRPDQLAEAAGRLGATASTPSLWIYTSNDTYFGPALATAMHDAFTGAGGRAELVRPGPYGEDGHELFFGRGGSAIWGPPVERYLVARGALPGS